ncbi:uncharacterized protein LOC109604649 isoform X1 [Aethina tumida]|uniref:uncharacterized protein LOC109604649 isoform X1 n=1 Tax=Aethina tumida TaxID=116153 RepID=UPI002148DC9C|nr:uncharacterized protein LOC109604649 isoform X1 [Aethina tumida]
MGMYVVVFSVLCVLTISCQQVPDSEDHVVHYISVFSPIGYHFHYKTRNGVERKETGVVDSNDDLKVDGNYAFYSSDGLKFSNVYQAGTQGFVPKWTYLPPEESDKKFDNKLNSQLQPNITLETNSSLTNSDSPLNVNVITTTINPLAPPITTRFPEAEKPILPPLRIIKPHDTKTSTTNVTTTETNSTTIPILVVGSATIATLAGGGLG